MRLRVCEKKPLTSTDSCSCALSRIAQADMLYPGSVFQTEGQRHWVEMQRRLLYASAPAKLDPPANRFRSWCFRAATSNEVEKWVMGAIFVNVLIMALRRYVRGLVLCVVAS